MRRANLQLDRGVAARIGKDLIPSDGLLWMHLNDQQKNGTAAISVRRLAELCGMTAKTVGECTKRLEITGFVEVTRADSLFREGVNEYRLLTRKPMVKVSTENIQWSKEDGFSGITERDRDQWAAAYPAVDVDRQLAAAHVWLVARPEQRKRNFYRFLANWFRRNQERGGDSGGFPRRTAKEILYD